MQTYTYQGLKRRLGLHQEKLTRILRRLEDDIWFQTEEGYRTSHTQSQGRPSIWWTESPDYSEAPFHLDRFARTVGKIQGSLVQEFSAG